jgi:allantoin racemase
LPDPEPATRILLINPNSSTAITAQMVAIAREAVPASAEIIGVTAARAPPMILQTEELAAAEAEVVEIGLGHGAQVDGIIIGAFGDPGLAALREAVRIPVAGIAEAALIEAAEGSRRFGVATTTPALVENIATYAHQLGLGELYTGIQLTPGDPLALVADPPRLAEALADAARRAIGCDGAEAVVIGGGPLSDAAAALAARFTIPIIAPIPAAMRRLMTALTP